MNLMMDLIWKLISIDTVDDASLDLLVTNIENKQYYETFTNEGKVKPAKDYYSGGASSIKKILLRMPLNL